MTGTGGSSELLQAGIVQKAFTQLVKQYTEDSSANIFQDYVVASAESVSSFLGNATKDTGYPLDRFSNGNALIKLSRTSTDANISTALSGLRKSLDLQTRNADGGLWYYVYPYWSYLDGMFSFAPFYAEYTTIEPQNSALIAADILHQLDLLWNRCLNESSGLLVHGYDYSKTAVWADVETGASPHVWGRSLGWYAMALVDTIELLPVDMHSNEYAELSSKTIRLLGAIVQAVDSASGAWWQVMDHPGEDGNYIESSGSAMFVYALLRAQRLGLSQSHRRMGTASPLHAATEVALRAYDFIVGKFVVNNGNGTLGYNGTVSVCSLNSTASYDVSTFFNSCYRHEADSQISTTSTNLYCTIAFLVLPPLCSRHLRWRTSEQVSDST
jgi:rhamnogalacturonyl hydrolase YesR